MNLNSLLQFLLVIFKLVILVGFFPFFTADFFGIDLDKINEFIILVMSHCEVFIIYYSLYQEVHTVVIK